MIPHLKRKYPEGSLGPALQVLLHSALKMLTISSLAAILLLASHLSPVADAQVVAPTCNPSWSWSSNSLGQSPCTVAAFLQGVCDNGVFTIPDLIPDDSYVGPTGTGDAADLCKCNTIVYSLMSACDACQGGKWFSWNMWSHNCSSIDTPTTYSNVIPDGTRVPGWAFLDVTKEGTWDPVLSYQVGDNTEAASGGPGSLSPLPTPTTTQTSVPGLTSSQLASTNGHGKGRNVGGIVGGILSGIAFIVASVGLLLWRARIKRRRTTRAAAAMIFANHAMPLQEKVNRGRDYSESRNIFQETI
ncbi:hypothetical protein BJV74DRAFT_244694 [Russula compacta]|nr:hypothetical protein BJV74DRAFT_244694 [Russula compacta]